jgi:hypothetical protein
MRAMFANLTLADFRRRSRKERLAAKRKWVHTVFDEIQVAIHKGDRPIFRAITRTISFVIARGPVQSLKVCFRRG